MNEEDEIKLKEMNSEIIALERRLDDLKENRDRFLEQVKDTDN